MFSFQCRVGAYKPLSTTLEQMLVFGITPKGEEIPLHVLIRNGVVKKDDTDPLSHQDLKRECWLTNLQYLKIFIQKKKLLKVKMFWSWIIELNNEQPRTILYSFSRTRGPLFIAGNFKILTKEEILTSNLFNNTTKSWATDELYKPAQATLDELIYIERPDPRQGIRKIHLPKKGEKA